jgi:acyl-homoserine-lactone acylase
VPGGPDGLEGCANQTGFYTLNSSETPRMRTGAAISRPDGSNPTGLTEQGYPVNFGTSFLFVVEFTADGPKADALMTYGQSSDSRSPRHGSQVEAFGAKAWRSVPFARKSDDGAAADAPGALVEVWTR